MANKKDNMSCRVDDESREENDSVSTAPPIKQRRTESPILDQSSDTAQQTSVAFESHGNVKYFKQEPNDGEGQSKPLEKHSSAALGYGDETFYQKTIAQAVENNNDTHSKTKTLVSHITLERDKNTLMKSLTDFSSTEETNTKTLIAVYQSSVSNVSDYSDVDSLKKPKYNTQVMLPDRQNLERHAGTLIDINNDIHSK